MKSYLLIAAAFAALAAGCTSYSTPTTNIDVITLSDGTQGYRVQCYGLFESSKACRDQVRKICKDRQPVLVMSAEHPEQGNKPSNDPREITFLCEQPKPAPAPVQPQPQPVPPAPAPAIRKITLQGDASFATGSSTLTPAAKSTLNQFVEQEQGVMLDRVIVVGHTDSTGSAAMNNSLSQARAESVKRYLTSMGVQARQFDVSGLGSSQPVASNKTAAGRAQNRRVEVSATGVVEQVRR